jgi:hypothetical protein
MWLEGDASMWGLTAAFVCAVACYSFVQLGRRASPHFSIGISTLGMMIAALGSLWGGSLLTVIVFWGWFDLFWTLGMMAVKASPRRVALSGGVFLLSSASLWIAAMLLRSGGGSLYWGLMRPSDLSRNLLVLAALLRLGLYPLHLAIPVGISRSAPGGLVLYLGPVLGWGLLLRLVASAGVDLTSLPWPEWMAIASLLVGGLMAWTRSKRSDVLPWVALASAGMTLWGAAVAADQASMVLTGGSVAWILGVTLLSLTRGLDRSAFWWSIPSFIGALALVGAFLTPGALVMSVLVEHIVAPLNLIKALAFAVGLICLTAGLARRVLSPVSSQEFRGPLAIAANVVGFSFSVLLILVGGVRPASLSSVLASVSVPSLMSGGGLLGWGIWLISVGLGIALFFAEGHIRPRIEPFLELVFDLISLDWLLYLALNGLGKLAGFMSTMAELIEGAGAILWAFAIFLIIILVMSGI